MIIVRIFVYKKQTSNDPIIHHFANIQIIVKFIYYTTADLFKVRKTYIKRKTYN